MRCFIVGFLVLFSISVVAQNKSAYFGKLGDYYTCGDIDIAGNKLTVEALVKLDGTGPYATGQSANDIVSKHNGAEDINYLLRPDHCEITTSTGYYHSTIDLSVFKKDSFYHVAMTYDGSYLRFYVNGCLYSETRATGNLYQNDYETTIGQLAANPGVVWDEQLYGYADEIRIWSVARTQQQIADNMHSLPNPQSQTGLVAYYNFENGSKNLQGTSKFDAVAVGEVAIKPQPDFAKVKKFNVTVVAKGPSCGNNDGSITVNASGGFPPYQIALNGNGFQTNPVFSNLPSGNYNITVKTHSAAQGCIETAQATLAKCVVDECSSWLRVGNKPSFARFGDLDVTGDQITVEATFNRTAPWNGIDLFQGDLVSKHEDTRDCNYLLRPSSAEITTSQGYFKTPEICPIELNKTYHAAMVYNGKTLKFYRNGFLMSEIAASGNLITNNWQLQVGLYFNGVTNEQFIGYINEVRIWKVARTQAELNEFMNKPLVNPQGLSGLLAYYTFDDLKNKQGNAQWDGTLHGDAKILQTNPNCTFVADNCIKTDCSTLPQPDFSIRREICTPGLFTFFTNVSQNETISWTIDGVVKNGALVTSVFSEQGRSHLVQMVRKTNDGCEDVIQKVITYELTNEKILDGSTTEICRGDSVLISPSKPLLMECFTTVGGVYMSPNRNGYYISQSDGSVSGYAVPMKKNLLKNADFSGGNQQFFSSYTFNPSTGSNGYFVQQNLIGTGIQTCEPALQSQGNMMIVRSAADDGAVIWKQQQIAVEKNTNYIFTVNFLRLSATGVAARTKVTIDGIQIDEAFSSISNNCTWLKQTVFWNSGDKTTIDLAIESANSNATQSIFAIDDLYFGVAAFVQDNISISVKAQPLLKLPADTSICIGATLKLEAETDAPNTFTWNERVAPDERTTLSIAVRPTINTFYTATVTGPNGCQSKDSVVVRVQPLPSVKMPERISICAESAVKLQPQYTNVDAVEWLPALNMDNNRLLEPTISATKDLMYHVQLRSKDGCISNDSIQVNYKPAPVGMVQKSGDVNCSTPTVQLVASGGVAYQWTPAQSLNNPLSAQTLASPDTTTTYKVKIIDRNECSVEIPITVEVKQEGQFGLFMPNAFTPNGDGVNDCFRVPNVSGAQTFMLQVFNRWGQLLYSSTNASDCWNGRVNGVIQPSGVYVYRVKVVTRCATFSQNGTFVLLQ